MRRGFSALSLVFDGSVTGDFARQLGTRIAGEGMTLYDVLDAMVKYHPILGGGSSSSATVMILTSMLGWSSGAAIVLVMAVQRRALSDSLCRDYVVVFLAASIVIAWLAFFRNHSSIHAFFMVRTLFVPLALGFAALPLSLCGALRASAVPPGSRRAV